MGSVDPHVVALARHSSKINRLSKENKHILNDMFKSRAKAEVQSFQKL